MKKLSLIKISLAAFAAVLFTSCTSPESAAEEVCGCFTKVAGSTNTAEMSGSIAECSELSSKYQGKFEGEDLNTFTTKVTECTVGSVSLR